MDFRKFIRIMLNILVPLLGIYVACFWGVRVLAFFMPFVIGWIVAMIANPLIRFLENRIRILRKHSSVVLSGGGLALVLLGLYLLIRWLIRSANGFIKDLPALYASVQAEVTSAYQGTAHLFTFLPADLETSLEQLVQGMGASIGTYIQDLAASAGGAVARSLPEVFVNTIVVFLSSYLFLAEHEKITDFFKARTPEFIKQYGVRFKRDLKLMIGGYFMAQFKIMFVVAIVLFIGFLVLGVSHGAALAAGIAVLDFLPMFGTGTALIPWAVVKIFTGEYAFAFGLAMIYILTQTIRQIIQPKIVGDSMGLPPLTTLFFLYIGFRLRGIAGMILAVPVGLIFINIYRYGAFDSLIENVKLLIEEIQKLRKEK